MDRRRRSLIRLHVLGGIRLPIRNKKVEPCKNLTAWSNSFATIFKYRLHENMQTINPKIIKSQQNQL
jgi:hypothetical protein